LKRAASWFESNHKGSAGKKFFTKIESDP